MNEKTYAALKLFATALAIELKEFEAEECSDFVHDLHDDIAAEIAASSPAAVFETELVKLVANTALGWAGRLSDEYDWSGCGKGSAEDILLYVESFMDSFTQDVERHVCQALDIDDFAYAIDGTIRSTT